MLRHVKIMSSLRAWNTTCKAQKIVTNKTTPSEAPTPVWSSATLKSTTGLSGRARPQSCVLERRAARSISTLPTGACRSDRSPMRRALSWMLWRVAAWLKFSWSQAAKIKKNMLQILFLFIFRLLSMPAGSQKSCTSLARRITYVLQWHKKDVKMQASVVSF